MEREREISIADLFFKILMAWRGVIISAVIFTLLFGGYAFYKYKKAQSGYEESLAAYEKLSESEAAKTSSRSYITDERAALEGFTWDETRRVNTTISYREEIARYEEYLNNSILMQQDPYKLKVYSRTMTVRSSSADAANDAAIAAAYLGYVSGGGLAGDIATAFKDAAPEYVSELISTDRESFANSSKVNANVVLPLNGSEAGTFTVSVIIPDGADEAAVKTAVDKALSDERQVIGQQIGAHELTVAGEWTTDTVDTEIEDRKVYYIDQIHKMRTNIATLTNGMSDKMLAIAYGTDSSSGTAQAPSKPGFSKKYLLIGFVLGGFLAVAFVALKFIFSGKLGNLKELKEYYGLRSLGNVSDKKKRKGLDRLFSSLRHKNEKKMDDETRVEIICSNIELLCEKEEIKKLVLTGTEFEKLDGTLKSEIKDKLSAKGIETVEGGNICYDMTALRSASEVGNAVVVEIEGVSKYREIEEELLAFKNNDINVLGCIGIGDVPA